MRAAAVIKTEERIIRMSENEERSGSSDRPRRHGGGRPERGSGSGSRGGYGGPRRDDGRGGGPRREGGPERGGARHDRRGSRDGGPRAENRGSAHNPGDLRSSNRPDRAKSPEIDEDVTGKELDRATSRELDTLDERNRPWVARHLVMAGRLLDIDPQLAFEHALAASRRGGRLGCVREAVGLTAYGAGQYAEALREFRTYRRITGDNTHLPEMVDSERALGRLDKALELAGDVDHASLEKAIRAELAMVLSGIHRDQGDIDSALAALRVPELDRHRGFSFSPRLFRAYADVLTEAGRGEEAKAWRRQASVADRALGIGAFEDPEIIDFGLDDDGSEDRPRARDLVPPGVSSDDQQNDQQDDQENDQEVSQADGDGLDEEDLGSMVTSQRVEAEEPSPEAEDPQETEGEVSADDLDRGDR
ncbi:hypothetical protein LG293_15760 [Citricoccus nitrophenolicus]|uniref:Tetratricopeptide repeat protein n=1 Tax=Citricoccus muralis TaxID=169134 RepID=A0A3D9LCM1_9MICC|nr:hypothetical protein [Citricoccus muralis]REE03424.1 hypothetical protein C8E99_1232 [Citricoccus muralis]